MSISSTFWFVTVTSNGVSTIMILAVPLKCLMPAGLQCLLCAFLWAKLIDGLTGISRWESYLLSIHKCCNDWLRISAVAFLGAAAMQARTIAMSRMSVCPMTLLQKVRHHAFFDTHGQRYIMFGEREFVTPRNVSGHPKPNIITGSRRVLWCCRRWTAQLFLLFLQSYRKECYFCGRYS